MRNFTYELKGTTKLFLCIITKTIIDAMNGLNKRRKSASLSAFDFLPTFYTKFPHNKLLIVLNSLIDRFCFDGGENKYITVNTYWARWVKNIKDNVICFNKQQVKDAVTYLLFNCYFNVDPNIFWQIIGIPIRVWSSSFLWTYSYIFMEVRGWTN